MSASMRRPVAGAVHLVVLEHGRSDALEDPLERDGLGVVGIEREAHTTAFGLSTS